MAKAVTIDTNIAKKLVRELEKFEEFKKQVLMLVPEELIPYGSKLWWEKSELEATEDIKKGRIVTLKSIDDLDKPIEKLFK
ncbi:MAG TPA: hypothetical protein VLG67_01320 [Candidatus Saccharimonadales bacterium]|nr:hypothetical protein [Candidatus Saccharimonadales bacterium]